jgi:ribokinase
MSPGNGGVCVVGSVNADTTLRVRALPGPGETVLADRRSGSGGGKGANQAAAAVAAGARVSLVAAVGADEAGDELRTALGARGIDVSAILTRGEDTGSAVVVVADDGENLIVVHPGANAGLDPDAVSRAVGELGASVLLGQLEVPVAALVAAARARGDALFILNPAPMAASAAPLAELLEAADLLVPNRSELAALVSRATPGTDAEVRACLDALECRADVVVTLGADGCLVRAAGEITAVPAPVVDTVDTSGAGDVFCGVLAAELAAGRALLEAVGRASTVAAASTTFHGAQVPADFCV